MTLQLDALEQAITITQAARRKVAWIDSDNPIWLILWHAEQYLAQEFKAEFRDYFKTDMEEHDK